jgi:hypothetical protein
MDKNKSKKRARVYRPKCVHCGRIFPAANQSALYCSGKCRTAACRARSSDSFEFNRPAEARKLVREKGISYSEASYKVVEARSNRNAEEEAKNAEAARILANRNAEDARIAEERRRDAERAEQERERREMEYYERRQSDPTPKPIINSYSTPFVEGQEYIPTAHQWRARQLIRIGGSRRVPMVPELTPDGYMLEDKFHWSFWRIPGTGERYIIDMYSPLDPIAKKVDENGNLITESLLKRLGFPLAG